MEQLQLRAWDSFNENMVYSSEPDAVFTLKEGKWKVGYVREKNMIIGGLEQDVPVGIESDELEIMLAAPIKDCNNKQIYAGDILLDLWSKNVYEVKFKQCKNLRFTGWYCENEDRTTCLNSDLDTMKNSAIEVIGNIYEHPELIKFTCEVPAISNEKAIIKTTYL